MAEEKPDSENPGASVRKYPPFPTTAEAEVAKGTGEVGTYTVKDQPSSSSIMKNCLGYLKAMVLLSSNSATSSPPGHRAPNTALLVLSWGVFSVGLYFLYAAGMDYYKDNVTEAKLAITVLLGIFTIPVGMFLRRAAHHGFRDAFAYMMESGWGQG